MDCQRNFIIRQAEKKFHNLKYIEKVADNIGSLTRDLSHDAESTNDASTTTYSISDLFNFVNTYDKEFKPKPVNETMIENGLPKKFYHQTSKDFTVFNTNSERAGKNDSKFYLHEATLIKEADLSSMTAPQLSVDTVNKSTSNNYIPHLPEIVNPDDNIFSLSEPVEEKGNAKYLLKLYVEEALPNKGGGAFPFIMKALQFVTKVRLLQS